MPLRKSRRASARPSKKTAVKCIISKGEAVFELSVKTEGLEPILGAAYLMMDRAFVLLGGDRTKTLRVALKAKSVAAGALEAAAEDFKAELEAQKLRWAIAKANQPIREFVVEQALLMASGAVPRPSQAEAAPAADELTAAQRSEIDRLIAEVEAEIKTLGDKKALADPKGIRPSWEEKQEGGKGA